MHPAAKIYLEMDSAKQKNIQIILCEGALRVWEQLVPCNRVYRESVIGSKQVLEATLPRDALAVVMSDGPCDSVEARYREPLAALQDDDISLPDQAEFAFYAIRNLFAAHALHKVVDPWLIANQALSSIGEENAISALEEALRMAC